MKIEIFVKPLDRNSLQEQLEVYRSAFHSSKNYEDSSLLWIKKHYENPLGCSLVFGAYYEGKLVGMNAYMPVNYQLQGSILPMLQSCESGVLPEFQGKGIWSKVVMYAIDYIFQNTQYQAIIGFPNYINSYPGFKKMGWKTLGGMNNYVMVNNSKEFIKNIFKSNKLLQIAGRLVSVQRICLGFNNMFYRRFKVGECGLDELIWDDNSDVLSVTHTKELLEWKKSYKNTKTLSIKKNEEIIASCIFSFGDYKDARIIKIEKCVLSNNSSISLKRALSLFAKFFSWKYPNIAFIRVWAMPDSALASAMKRLLFLKSSHPNPFIIKHNSVDFSSKKWNLSFFDLD